MRPINLASDVKITAMPCGNNRLRGAANVNEHGARWFITVSRDGKSCTFPYLRGGSLSQRSSIDTVAVFKAVMMNMAVLAVCPTKGDMEALEFPMSPLTFNRLTVLQMQLKDVLGDEFQRVLNIVLENVQETANAPA